MSAGRLRFMPDDACELPFDDLPRHPAPALAVQALASTPGGEASEPLIAAAETPLPSPDPLLALRLRVEQTELYARLYDAQARLMRAREEMASLKDV